MQGEQRLRGGPGRGDEERFTHAPCASWGRRRRRSGGVGVGVGGRRVGKKCVLELVIVGLKK